MIDKPELEPFKEGQEVILSDRYTYKLSHIEKVTPTGSFRVKGDNHLFDKSGRAKGDTHYFNKMYVERVTPEKRERAIRAELVGSLAYSLDSKKIATLKTDQLRRIQAILNETKNGES